MPCPRFSVVMPCYNAAEQLDAAIDSVVKQSCGDWELIAVDDGSTDATPNRLAARFKEEPRLRVVRVPNGGPARARNIGAEAARGAILAFLDADDLWTPDRLAVLADMFSAEPMLDAAFGRVAFFRRDVGRPDTVSYVPAGLLSAETLLGENPVCTLSNLAIRGSAFQEAGGFDERLVHNEDMEFLVRLAGRGGQIRGIDRLLCHYRTSADGLSADLGRMRQGWQAARATAERHGLPPRSLKRAEAIHLRYLARRALRVPGTGIGAARLALEGMTRSPAAFLSDPRRGAATFAGALAAPFLSERLRRCLFA